MKPHPESQVALLLHVGRLLDDNKPEEAFSLLRACKMDSADIRNATGVVLMRMGHFEEAVGLLRKLVTNDSGISLRPELPTVYKVNFATALLMNGNVTGALSVLSESNDDSNHGVVQLRKAISHWRRSLTWPQRLWLWVAGGAPDRPVALSGLPGELRMPPPRHPRRSAA